MSKSDVTQMHLKKDKVEVRSSEFQVTVIKSITSLPPKKWITFRILANVHPFLPVKWTLEK